MEKLHEQVKYGILTIYKLVLTLPYSETSVTSQKLSLVEIIFGNITGTIAAEVGIVASYCLVNQCFGGPLRQPDVAPGLTTLMTVRQKRQYVRLQS